MRRDHGRRDACTTTKWDLRFHWCSHTSGRGMTAVGVGGDLLGLFFIDIKYLRVTSHHPIATPNTMAPFERRASHLSQCMSVCQLMGFAKKTAPPSQKIAANARAERTSFMSGQFSFFAQRSR
ncbi:MAG: hypothetical protein Q7S40_30945 [Opitutaceae bacterium]|nr:hypothetical protein [Opitutaceae bacterium]